MCSFYSGLSGNFIDSSPSPNPTFGILSRDRFSVASAPKVTLSRGRSEPWKPLRSEGTKPQRAQLGLAANSHLRERMRASSLCCRRGLIFGTDYCTEVPEEYTVANESFITPISQSGECARLPRSSGLLLSGIAFRRTTPSSYYVCAVSSLIVASAVVPIAASTGKSAIAKSKAAGLDVPELR